MRRVVADCIRAVWRISARRAKLIGDERIDNLRSSARQEAAIQRRGCSCIVAVKRRTVDAPIPERDASVGLSEDVDRSSRDSLPWCGLERQIEAGIGLPKRQR